MAIGAIIALCACGAGLLAIGIILLVMGGKPKYAKGKRYVDEFYPLKTTLIVDMPANVVLTKTGGNKIARYCSTINATVREQFTAARLTKDDVLDKTRHIIVQLMHNDVFVNMLGEKYQNSLEHSSATLLLTRCWFWGEAIPTICVKVKDSDTVTTRISSQGEPIVHELCHAYLNDYVGDSNDHTNKKVWIEAGGQDTIQLRARAAIAARNKRSAFASLATSL